MPEGFWDEPAPLPDSTPATSRPAAKRAGAHQAAADQTAASQPAADAAAGVKTSAASAAAGTDSPLDLVQALFPGRVLTIERPAEPSAADASAEDLLSDDPELSETGDSEGY